MSVQSGLVQLQESLVMLKVWHSLQFGVSYSLQGFFLHSGILQLQESRPSTISWHGLQVSGCESGHFFLMH